MPTYLKATFLGFRVRGSGFRVYPLQAFRRLVGQHGGGMDMAVQEPVLKRHQARSWSSAAGATPWFQLRWHCRLHESQLLPVLLPLLTVMFVRLTFFFCCCCCCCGGGDGGGGWSHRCFLQRLLAEAVPSSIGQLRPSPTLSLSPSLHLSRSLTARTSTRQCWRLPQAPPSRTS